MALLLYDGTCGFCDGTVQWCLARDPAGRLRYAPLGGPTAEAVRARHPEWPADLDSLVLVTGEGDAERIAWHMGAVVGTLRALGGAWGVVGTVLAWVPRPLADLGYRAFARVRHRVAGRLETCRVPGAGERARFLP